MRQSIIDQGEKIIIDVLMEERRTLLEAFGNVDFQTKDDKTQVTHLDHMIEKKLRAKLRSMDNGIGILGEEQGHEGNKDTYWLLDPIDGTEDFIRGIHTAKNLACLIEDGKPVWALCYGFTTDDLWLARAGKGATHNGKPHQMRYRPLEDCLIGFELVVENPKFFDITRAVAEKVHKIAGPYSYVYLLPGKADGLVTLRADGKIWDYAPRVLIYEESGGRMANFGKEAFDINNPTKEEYIMCHERNFDQLMKIVTEA